MAEQQLPALSLADISIDEEGRVIITNEDIAEQLRAQAPQPAAPVNNGCTINTVRNCGCRPQ
jgi:hypothetical protein